MPKFRMNNYCKLYYVNYITAHTSSFQYSITPTPHPVSSIQFSIQYPVSSIQYSVSSIQYPVQYPVQGSVCTVGMKIDNIECECKVCALA